MHHRKNVNIFGAVDGKVVDSKMAKKMVFLGRFGSSCGRVFDSSKFLKENPKYEKMRPYLRDFPKRDWVHIKNII